RTLTRTPSRMISPRSARITSITPTPYLQGRWSEDRILGTRHGGYQLTAVSSTATGDAWAAGTKGMTLKRTGPTDWLEVTTRTTDPLLSIFAISGEEAWVGGVGPHLHYSGGQWLRIPRPPLTSPLKRIWMLSSDEGWAVGTVGTILYYAHGNWVQVPSVTDQTLNDLYMVSPNEGWAVGEQGTILHYQDGTWQPYSP
ncbi:MAG TPA: hypothetical protein VKY74_18075, partial [Chloroflexia bacterium]|nr:hypothetical protein [Chloroflexia bacterium]